MVRAHIVYLHLLEPKNVAGTMKIQTIESLYNRFSIDSVPPNVWINEGVHCADY